MDRQVWWMATRAPGSARAALDARTASRPRPSRPHRMRESPPRADRRGRHQHRGRRCVHRIVHPRVEPAGHAGDDPADEDAADHRDREALGHLADGHRAGDRRDRHAQQHDRGRVVQQRLTLQDRHHPPWQANAPRDGGRGDGVRRADDRAQRERSGQRDRQQPVGDRANGDRRERHEPDRQQADGLQAPCGSRSATPG